MAASNQDIKDFFALSGNNPAVTNPQLVKLAAAVGKEANEDGSPATPDQFVDAAYTYYRNLTIYNEQDEAARSARSAVEF
jgi:hypothetical protein